MSHANCALTHAALALLLPVLTMGCDLGDQLDSPDMEPAGLFADLDMTTVDNPEAQRLLVEWQTAGAIREADVNRDGVVNIADLVLVARNFGQTVELPPVSIATFNIQAFGEAKRGDAGVMDVLADIADEFDIMAVQEIRDASGATPYVYLERMNAQGEELHMVAVSPRLGRTRSTEQYAIYYDMNWVRLLGSPMTYPDPDDVFEREPFGARFEAGGFDFVLLNVHIKPDDAPAEISALGDVVAWAVAAFGDEDVVVAGDLTADCDFFDEDGRELALPLNWITPIDFDTTVAGTVCTYDNVILSDALMDEFTGTVEVFRFDLQYGLAGELSEDVSDHYPVWASFSTSAP